MTQPAALGRRPVPWLALVVVVVVGLTATWILLRRYTSPGARECVALYYEARTAADTARIDTTVVAASLKETDPRSCGSMRVSSRWQ